MDAYYYYYYYDYDYDIILNEFQLIVTRSFVKIFKRAGKGGATVNELQQSTNCRIQLTKSGEVFPGTQERVLTMIGELPNVLTAVHLICTKLQTDEQDNGKETMDNNNSNHQSDVGTERQPRCRLVIPNAAAGCVIGKGGSTIKSFIEDSEADIRLSSQNQAPPGCHDRILTISGMIGQILRAVALIAANLLEDQNYSVLIKRPSTYRPSFDYGHSRGSGGHHSGNFNAPMTPNVDPANVVSATMQVDDSKMGPILGKGGRTITEIQVQSRCKIRVSDRNDLVPGTNLRTVHISGSVEGVQIAWQMVEDRLRRIEEDEVQTRTAY